MGYALGIDLGTTYTAAAIYRDGRVETVSLGSHANTIPTVAYARESGEILVGEAALARGLNDPGRFAKEFKRRLGSTTDVVLGGETYETEALLGHVLRSVVDTVTSYCGEPPLEIVITHPASWADHRLQRLEAAIASAGIDAASLAAEPVAASVFYASQERIPDDAVIAVYDLGGGTFDASVLRKTGAGFELVAHPEGDDDIGGIDFDRAVLEHVASSLGDSWTTLDLTDGAVASGVERLRRSATSAKELLSDDLEVTIPVALPGINRDVRLTRGEFEARIRPDIESTLDTMERALANARMGADEVHTVLLVGGSSRVPLVGEIIGNGLGRPLAIDAHPKLAICQGASLVAAQRAALAGAEPDPEPAPVPAPVPEPLSAPELPDAAPPGSRVVQALRASMVSMPRGTSFIVGFVAVMFAAVAVAALVLVVASLTGGSDGGETVDPPVTVVTDPPITAVTEPPLATTGGTEGAAPLVLPPGDPVSIEIWYLDNEDQATLEPLISEFEAANPEIDVIQTLQTGSRSSLELLFEAEPEDRPEVVSVDIRSTQTMLDSGFIVPAHEMIAQDDFDVGSLLPVSVAQLSTTDGLVAVPHRPWSGVAYLNLEVLAEAGVDLDGIEDWTTADLLDACRNLEGLVEFCFTYENSNQLYAHMLGNAGGLLVDGQNGREGRATAAQFDNPLGRDLFSFFVDSSVAGQADIGSGRGDLLGFARGESAIALTSSWRLITVQDQFAEGETPFEIGAARLPHLPGTVQTGAPPDGLALWQIDSGNEREKIASWLLVDFLSGPDQQAFVHRGSVGGPLNVDAEPQLAEFWAENPEFEVSFRQLLDTNPTKVDGTTNFAALGAMLGGYNQFTVLIKDAIATAISDGGASESEVFDTLIEDANQMIADYTASLDPVTGILTTSTTTLPPVPAGED